LNRDYEKQIQELENKIKKLEVNNFTDDEKEL
jgi:hypothetical protein